ncbi:MAG: hypothetical protein E7158_00180 [Firmicutes bacterium]|nr:hypothetical protein [Bacillota bacterium]
MRKTLKIGLASLLVAACLFTVTGCDKKDEKVEKKDSNNTVEISNINGKGTITLSVPKNDEGKAKYEFTTEKPEGISKSGTFYLVTDKAMIAFLTSGLSYNTSKDYKAKYGDKKATFDGYLEFIEDKDLFDKSYLPGLEQFKINDRKALRYYNRSGSSNAYKYFGYFYMVAADDIYTGSKLELVVNYKDEEKPKEAKELDKETLDIIKSLKLQANS